MIRNSKQHLVRKTTFDFDININNNYNMDLSIRKLEPVDDKEEKFI